jgi:hypothetical protein
MGVFLPVRCKLHVAQDVIALAFLTQSTTPPSAHNARFDFHFLNAEFSRARWEGGLHTGICTLALARKVLSGAAGQDSYRLGDLVKVRGSGCGVG